MPTSLLRRSRTQSGKINAGHADAIFNAGVDPYTDQFSMYPGGSGGRGGAPTNFFRTNMKDHFRSMTRYVGPNAFTNFSKDRRMEGRSPGSLLGTAQGNIAHRQKIHLVKGVVRRASATDAILYEIQSIPGRLGYISPHTERYRNKYRSMGWRSQLTQSEGPNKAPHGIAQSSLDTTLARYATIETKYLNPGFHDSNEKWDPETKKWERQWKGWKQLKVHNRWKHYTPLSARMFKEKEQDDNEGKGSSRRFVRSIL